MEEEGKLKKRKSNIFSIVFILAVTVGLIVYIICTDGFENIINVLTTANYAWILVGVVFLLTEWGLEALAMHIPLKKMYPKHKYFLSFRTNLVGRMFNNITPFSSGGQPFQTYVLSKHGLKASDSFSVLMIRFVVYQVALFSWVLILLLTNFQTFMEVFGDYIWLVWIGFFANLVATVFIIVAGVNKKFILKLANVAVKWASKVKIGKHRAIKNVDKALLKVNESVSNYSEQFNIVRGQWSTLIKMYITSMVQLVMYFVVPYTIYKAFGNSGVEIYKLVTVQAFLLLIMSFIPTPGSGLGAEGGFALFYRGIFINGLNMSMLFWRIFTFYLPIIVGSFVFVSVKKVKEKDEVGVMKD